MVHRELTIVGTTMALLLAFASGGLVAQTEEEMAAMQRQLNKEVLEKPFSVEAEEKIDAYIKEAMEKDLQPEAKSAPDYWRPGYTCADVYQYGWQTYRNCRYYLRYHGYYWR